MHPTDPSPLLPPPPQNQAQQSHPSAQHYSQQAPFQPHQFSTFNALNAHILAAKQAAANLSHHFGAATGPPQGSQVSQVSSCSAGGQSLSAGPISGGSVASGHTNVRLHHTSGSVESSGDVSDTASTDDQEELNTKDLAQRISAELKRYSIPQAIFAQRVLCRSQGTLSDLLRNPKPWSKLKSGRETFRRMQKWLEEPEFQRMSSLRLAGKCHLLLFSFEPPASD